MGKIISFLLRIIPRKYLQLFSHIPLKIYTFFLKGNNVECPVCDAKLSKFLPYGRLVSRPNALCPNCLALERHRLMALYMKQRTNFYTAGHSGGVPLKVLHVAPEYCFIDRFEEMKNLEYITADIESPLAKVKMDIHEIPFEANTFDVAICNHVMEHVNDYHKAMSELYRVLKPNAWAIIQSPQDWTKAHTFEDPTITDPRERERVFWQNDHLRLFGRDYGRELEKAGFIVTEDDFVIKMSKDLVKRYSLPSEEIVYFCEKK